MIKVNSKWINILKVLIKIVSQNWFYMKSSLFYMFPPIAADPETFYLQNGLLCVKSALCQVTAYCDFRSTLAYY